MPPQEQEGPIYDWRTSTNVPPPVFDWQQPTMLRQSVAQTGLDALRALGLQIPPAPEIPGLSLPRPAQFALDPLGPEEGPQTLGENLGYAVGAATMLPAGTLRGLRQVPRLWKAARMVALGDEAKAAGQALLHVRSFDDPWRLPFTQAAKASGWDDQTIDSAQQVLETTARIYKAHPDILPLFGGVDAAGKPIKAWRDNADFGKTFDVNRTCNRVAKYWETVRAVETRIKRPMDENELLYLGQRMRNDGDIPGCVFCYVEASRRAAQRNASILTSKSFDDIAAMDLDDTAKLPEYAAKRDALLRQMGWVTKQGQPDLRRFAELTVTPAKQERVLAQGGAGAQLVDLYKDYVLSAKGTMLTGNGSYFGELLKLSDEEVARMNSRAGARWWSATDFDPTQALESLKAMSDATVRKLAGHGYTKEPYTSLIFGNTGMKVNTSVAVNWDGKKFVSDDVNGMPLDVALWLRKQYPDTGTMLVAKNLDQIKWGLDNPQIDMMIPHHAANWTGGPSKYGIFGLDDFSHVQHERWAPDAKVPQVFMPKSQTYRNATVEEVFGKVREKRGQGPNQLVFKYWLDQAGNNEQRAVQLYLDFCKKNGLVPKFGPGTYKSGSTKRTEVFPGFTEHPAYAKLLKDYARTDTPQRPLNVHGVDQGRLVEYLQEFVQGGGWTRTRTPNPTTVDAMASRLRRGAPPITVDTLRAGEQYLQQNPTPIQPVTTLSALLRSGQTTGKAAKPGVPRVYLPLQDVTRPPARRR